MRLVVFAENRMRKPARAISLTPKRVCKEALPDIISKMAKILLIEHSNRDKLYNVGFSVFFRKGNFILMHLDRYCKLTDYLQKKQFEIQKHSEGVHITCLYMASIRFGKSRSRFCKKNFAINACGSL